MVIFHSYFSLPEGSIRSFTIGLSNMVEMPYKYQDLNGKSYTFSIAIFDYRSFTLVLISKKRYFVFIFF